jgi:hypothetical protein
VFAKVDRYDQLDSMLPMKSDPVFLQEMVCPLLSPFDYNNLEFDYFWAIGPLLFYNGATKVSKPRSYRLHRDENDSFGLRLLGDRPVWCV